MERLSQVDTPFKVRTRYKTHCGYDADVLYIHRREGEEAPILGVIICGDGSAIAGQWTVDGEYVIDDDESLGLVKPDKMLFFAFHMEPTIRFGPAHESLARAREEMDCVNVVSVAFPPEGGLPKAIKIEHA